MLKFQQKIKKLLINGKSQYNNQYKLSLKAANIVIKVLYTPRIVQYK